VARGTRIQPGGNGSRTTTDRGAPNNSSAIYGKVYTFRRQSSPLWLTEGFSAFVASSKGCVLAQHTRLEKREYHVSGGEYAV
jgi:hypothetical protein